MAELIVLIAPIAALAFAVEATAREEQERRDRLRKAARKRARSHRPWQAPERSDAKRLPLAFLRPAWGKVGPKANPMGPSPPRGRTEGNSDPEGLLETEVYRGEVWDMGSRRRARADTGISSGIDMWRSSQPAPNVTPSRPALEGAAQTTLTLELQSRRVLHSDRQRACHKVCE